MLREPSPRARGPVCVEQALPPRMAVPNPGLDETMELLSGVLGAGEEDPDLSALSAALKAKLGRSDSKKPPPTLSPGVQISNWVVKSCRGIRSPPMDSCPSPFHPHVRTVPVCSVGDTTVAIFFWIVPFLSETCGYPNCLVSCCHNVVPSPGQVLGTDVCSLREVLTLPGTNGQEFPVSFAHYPFLHSQIPQLSADTTLLMTSKRSGPTLLHQTMSRGLSALNCHLHHRRFSIVIRERENR